MIAWLNPAALLGLLAVAGPVVVHLLRRRQAPRVVIPSTRFVQGTNESSVRFRSPSDALLLLVRMSIVASAALALARPVIVTDARMAAWNDRTARAVVVDRSDSARAAIDAEAVRSETSSASVATLIETDDPVEGVARAAAWLAQAPPAKREIAVLSDFQVGSVTIGALTMVPPGVGLRFVRFGSGRAQEPDLPRVWGASGSYDVVLRLDGAGTAVGYRAAARQDGLDLQLKPEDAAEETSLREIVAQAGTYAPSPAYPVILRFNGAGAAAAATEDAKPWMYGAAQRLLRSPLTSAAAIGVGRSGEALVVDVKADPRSFVALEATKAVLDAVPDPRAISERESERIAESQLAQWSRPPGPADPGAWRQGDESDARWLWGAALVLLLIESRLRRTAPRLAPVEEAHAA